MATDVQMSVTLTPVGEPWVSVRAPGFNKCSRLLKTTKFDIEFLSNCDCETLEIEHRAKSTHDATTAVIVDSIDFFGIQDPRFAWQGVYYPVYPEPWFSQQVCTPAAALPAQTYLGWNGIYQLRFGVPVFTWIHQVQNLGWIYQ